MTHAREADGYFYDRAEFELQMAQKAQGVEAVRAHYQLANLYLDRYYSSGSAEQLATDGGEMLQIGTTI